MQNTELKKYEWYNCIEEPIRDLVFLLRNNGFNTESSCGHEKYIQCQYILDGEFMELNKLISCYLYEHKMPLNYRIELTIAVINGHQYPSLLIYLNLN